MLRRTLCLLSFSALLSVAASAEAAPGANLTVTIAAPTVQVDQVGRYSVVVGNIGSRHAQNVVLTIDLPKTATSPTVHLMGVLGAFDSRCTRAGTRLTCNLGEVRRNVPASPIWFDLSLPYATAPLAIDVDASTSTNEQNPANDTLRHIATPSTVNVPVTGPVTVANRLCSGTNLTSFYECELYPGSLSSFSTTLAGNGTVSVPGEPSVTGSWSQPSTDRLVIEYIESGNVMGTFDGRGVRAKCFEGIMPFGTHNAMYEVCLP